MKTNYLSYNQASAVCEAHQHLVGKPFDRNDESEGIISMVVVAPYSRILQWKFVRCLLQGAGLEAALSLGPNGRYDVLLLPDPRDRSTVNYRGKSIRCYLREHGIEFNIARSNILRNA